MQIAFWHSWRYGGSPLVGGLKRGLESLGHTVFEDAQEFQSYDLICMFTQVAHVTNYEYMPFPQSNSPICLIDASEFGYFRRLPEIVREYSHSFAPASMQHDTKNAYQQERLKQFLEGRSFVYFLREHSRYLEYPASYVPIDYPLYYLSVCDQRPNREEYLNRTKGFWNSWGGSHPWRLPITYALREAGYECLLLEENGQARLPQHAEYFPRMMQARASCSFDGYGSGSFRRTEVLVRTLLLDGPLTIRTYAPLTDGLNVVAYEVENDGEAFLGTNIVEKLRKVLECPEWAFGIYEAGFNHCMENYTEQAYARYVLSKVEGYDYSATTPLSLA